MSRENHSRHLSDLVIQTSRLSGTVRLSGAKNSALRLLAASLLTSEPVTLYNYPDGLADAQIHVRMLEELGKDTRHLATDGITVLEAKALSNHLNWQGRSIRNTLLILGALVARTGAGSVPLPGGCNLGDRKYDLHELVLTSLGADVWVEQDRLCAQSSGPLVGTEIHLPIRSTGATENALIASTLAEGVTRIWNPHIRPEILDLVALLSAMGAEIRVFGQEHIEVTGVEALSGAEHRVIPDNMEAITWLVASVITDGDVEILDFPIGDLEVVLAHLKAAGARLYFADNSVIVRGGRCYPIEISTGPHPGINSDMQPILAAWAANARGESRIIDLRFPGRYAYANEMGRMGMQHQIRGEMLCIQGAGGRLYGTDVHALDLRAGAALAICGLAAEGETVIHDAWQILRGYDGFVEKALSLGANMTCNWLKSFPGHLDTPSVPQSGTDGRLQ